MCKTYGHYANECKEVKRVESWSDIEKDDDMIYLTDFISF